MITRPGANICKPNPCLFITDIRNDTKVHGTVVQALSINRWLAAMKEKFDVLTRILLGSNQQA